MALVNGSVDHHLRGRRPEKVWRSVRWAENFPEEEWVDMDSVDLTPPFAIRKIANLFERGKFSDCASIVGSLQGIGLASILAEVPIERLHETLPASLPIVEALYVKVQKSGPQTFPTGQLMTDSLVKRLVTVFAHQSTQREFEKASIINSCRTILSIILTFERKLKDIILQRKRAIDRCLRDMGRHGLVDSSGGKLMLLHDALKVEFEKVLIQYKCALHKLDELSLATKYPMATSVSSGPAPSEASHQRLMQVDRAEVQDRIIKNKSLHNVVEPAFSNQHLRKLILALQRRIEYDKILLFHDTELRKMSEGLSTQHIHLSQTLRQFSQGYGQLLVLIADILGEDTPTDPSQFDDSSSEEGDEGGGGGGLPITSTLSILERMKIISLNAVIPLANRPGARNGEKGSGRYAGFDTIEENGNGNGTTALSHFLATQPRHHLHHHHHIHNGEHTPTTTTSITTITDDAAVSSPSTTTTTITTTITPSSAIISCNSTGYVGGATHHPVGGGRYNSISRRNYYHHNNHHNHTKHPHHHQPIKPRPQGAPPPSPYISHPILMGMMDRVESSHSTLQTFTPSHPHYPHHHHHQHHVSSTNGHPITDHTMTITPSSPATPNVDLLEKEKEIKTLREELTQSREHIHRLQEQEKQLRERLSTFVHHQFTTKPSTPFEDLNLGSLRPTHLIRCYDDLYREGRIDTLDALDALPELKGLDILKMKILFSVVVLSFRCVQQSLHELKGRLRHLLCLTPPPPPSRELTTVQPSDVNTEMEAHINNYLCRTIDTHDITPMINEVCQNICATLYDYPGLQQCDKLLDYAKTTVRLAWGLTVQTPPFYILYDLKTFQEQTLSRFHTSDSECTDVKSFLWPILVDGQTGQCVAKGVVIT